MKRETTLVLISLILFSSYILNAQIERSEWEFGGGVRLNYLGLNGGYEGERYSDGYKFKLNYQEIGMDNYSPSLAIAFGGRYKRWNLAFAGSRGSYKGEFDTKFDIARDNVQINSGSLVSGKMDIY